MTRNLKALILAFLAMIALSAVSASGAAAEAEHKFHSEVEHTVFDITQDEESFQEFKIPTGWMECEKLVGTATLNVNASTQLRVVPHHENCQFIIPEVGSFSARVTTTECEYVFTGETNPSKHSLTHRECESPSEGFDIQLFFLGKWFNCLRVPSSTPTAGGSVYKTVGVEAERRITIEMTMEGLTYEITGSMCGEKGFTANDGEYFGNAIVEGTSTEGEQVGVWFE